MPTGPRTKSERLFEEICALHGISCTRLLERPDGPQPDYELQVDGHRIAAEVKQIETNDGDRLFAEELSAKGRAFERRNPDEMAERVRDDIDHSRGQLRAYLERHPGAAALLVLYDDARNGYDDPNIVRTAMFGWEQVLFALTDDGPAVADRGFGYRNNSEIRRNKNCHLSALVTLHEATDFVTRERALGLCFYHNPFADVPFAPQWWKGDRVSHLRLAEKSPGQFQDFASWK